ncbi:MAG: hypothetical protein ACE5JU_02790 [Candidatus Binatia bacterium]
MVFFILITSSLLYFFSYPEVDPDLWGHLFFGREILKGGEVPQQNIYSYTAPNHAWINHEWLAEVIFYGLFHLSGSPGLILLKIAIGAGVVWTLDRIIRKRIVSPLARTLTLVWAMAILSPGFNVRPQLFTYFLFAVFLLLFYRHEEKERTTLYWAPLLTAFWVNLHGGFVAGLGALGVFSLWTAIRESRSGGITGQTVSQAFIPLTLSLLFLALNPHGLELVKFLWKDLLLDRPITEWEPIPLMDLSSLEFKLALLFVLIFSMRSHSWLRWDFILTVLAALFAFRYQRHTPLFAIAAAPLLAEGLQRITRSTDKGGRKIVWPFPSRWILAAGILGIALLQMLWVGRIHLEHRLRLVVNPSEYPTQAADFLERSGIRGNAAVPFDWGEYFIWKLYPKIRVSIDGRYTTAYPMEVIEDSWEWMSGGSRWRRLLEHYATQIAITKRSHPVTALLRKDPAWAYIYSDPIAFIFVKNDPGLGPLLERFRGKKPLPPTSPPIYFPG